MWSSSAACGRRILFLGFTMAWGCQQQLPAIKTVCWCNRGQWLQERREILLVKKGAVVRCKFGSRVRVQQSDTVLWLAMSCLYSVAPPRSIFTCRFGTLGHLSKRSDGLWWSPCDFLTNVCVTHTTITTIYPETTAVKGPHPTVCIKSDQRMEPPFALIFINQAWRSTGAEAQK